MLLPLTTRKFKKIAIFLAAICGSSLHLIRKSVAHIGERCHRGRRRCEYYSCCHMKRSLVSFIEINTMEHLVSSICSSTTNGAPWMRIDERDGIIGEKYNSRSKRVHTCNQCVEAIDGLTHGNNDNESNTICAFLCSLFV